MAKKKKGVIPYGGSRPTDGKKKKKKKETLLEKAKREKWPVHGKKKK